MAGESLQQYKQKQQQVFWTNAGMPSNNFSRNHDATTTPYERSGSNGYPSLIFSNIPNMNWQGKTYDSILANNSVSRNSGSDVMTTISTIFTAATGALGLAAAVGQTVSLFSSNKSDGGFSRKESKEIAKNTENADEISSALDSSISTAETVNEKTSAGTLDKVTKNLQNSIKQANGKITLAQGAANSAKITRDRLDGERTDISAERDALNVDISALSEQLKTLNKKDTKNMTAQELAAHKKEISDLEAQIKTKEKLVKDKDNQIEQLTSRIEVQDEIIKENNNVVKDLKAKVNLATKQMERINSIHQ